MPNPETPPYHEDFLSRIRDVMSDLLSDALSPGLYLVATPIGNLGDITLRALSVLARVDSVYCEDTRHSRILLSHYKISQDLKSYHEHNAAQQRPRMLRDLKAQKSLALISDAGTPLISDPGYKLVAEALSQDLKVWVLPGPSAVLAGMCLSGLPIDRFLFGGFLPPRAGARHRRIAELAQVPATLIFFETPSRLAETLKDLAQGLGARQAAVGRELTKIHEEVTRGSLSDLAHTFAHTPILGECVVLVGPPDNREISDSEIEGSLSKALQTLSLRDAAKAVAEELSVAKARVYALGLTLTHDTKGKT